ncbi:MAG: RluA family pseudouridine synthase [Bacilli bacterium]|nr:RluA family pseudouridine synthase [Bacilli bacterium]
MNNLKILYEDNHLIVVIKPINVLSQSDITNIPDMLTILKKYIKEKYNKPGNVYLGLVHRLDRPTGGIMVFARTSKAAARLSKQIQNKEFKKSYLAIIHGNIQDKDTYTDYLEKIDTKSYITTKEKGKYAELSFEKLDYKKDENLSLVKVNLKTGRNHQIRLQFASRGYPLYGDNKYGNDKDKNLGLYAYKLEFNHPTTKEKLTFEDFPKHDPFNKFDIKK